jgi:hypothetical protein
MSEQVIDETLVLIREIKKCLDDLNELMEALKMQNDRGLDIGNILQTINKQKTSMLKDVQVLLEPLNPRLKGLKLDIMSLDELSKEIKKNKKKKNDK